MRTPDRKTYLAVGHITNDRLPDGSHATGGTVTYAATAAKRLGWQPIVLTACAGGFVAPPELAAIGWRIVNSTATTTFRNEYGPWGRTQIIDAVADGIGREQVPADCRQAALVHLGPVAREIDTSVATCFPGAFLCATLQGWLRTWNEKGIVSLGAWPGAEQLLPSLQAAVVSIEDIQGDWTHADRWSAQTPVLVVTQTRQGCTVYHDGRKTWIRPRPAREVDPTGAGDVFAAFFFVHLYETGDVEASAYFANIAASMSVEHPRVAGIPSRAKVDGYLRRTAATCPPGSLDHPAGSSTLAAT